MASSRQLTGGSRDVNPQYASIKVVESAANTFTELAVPLPVTKIPQASRATIIELLAAYIDFVGDDYNAALEAIFLGCSTSSRTGTGTVAQLWEGTTLFVQNNQAFSATPGFVTSPFYQDFTDGAGHGILIATDNIFFQIKGNALATPVTAAVKLLYRFKTVTLLEYVGIVQSQQQVV